jgi:hypothetical protein
VKRAALVLALVAPLLLPQVAAAEGPGDAEVDSPEGTSALVALAQADGHHANLIRDQFRLPPAPGVLFVVAPGDPFSGEEADAVSAWVAGGGVLVYAASVPEPRLESALGLTRSVDAAAFSGHAVAATPLLSGVESVELGGARPLASPGGRQVALLRSPGHDVVAVAGPLGRGHFFALASADPLTNGHLANADNGALAADLLTAAGTAAEVSFDQFHHGGGAGQESSLAWMTTPWGLAILAVVLVTLGLLVARGRAFGPRLPLRPERDPSSAEFTAAVGAMLRRARAQGPTIERLLQATRSALARQAGIREGADDERLEAALAQRSPALAEALRRAVASARSVHDEGSLAASAAELHRLARPPLTARAPRPANPRRK